jgi:hypothetical protein
MRERALGQWQAALGQRERQKDKEPPEDWARRAIVILKLMVCNRNKLAMDQLIALVSGAAQTLLSPLLGSIALGKQSAGGELRVGGKRCAYGVRSIWWLMKYWLLLLRPLSYHMRAISDLQRSSEDVYISKINKTRR